MRYTIDRSWEMLDTITVEADNRNDAIQQAYDTPVSVGRYVINSICIDYIEPDDDDTPDP